MATLYPLPDGLKIKSILGLLFEDIEVSPGGKLDGSATGGAWFGVYINDTGEPVALCASDAKLSAYWSAALSVLPVKMAREAAQQGELSDMMVANLREIMNICTRLVMSEHSPHLRLENVYCAGTLPAAAAALVGAARGRSDFQVALPKYGSGQLALLSS